MALNLSTLCHQSWSAATPVSSSDTTARTPKQLPRRLELGWITNQNSIYGSAGNLNYNRAMSVRVKCGGGVRASLGITTEAQVEGLVGKVTEVCKDSFWPIVNAAKDKTVVLDMYTQWCGPCKIIAPRYEKLAQEKLDVIFLKLDCNQENKPLAKELGIRVVPTFKILKDSKVVKEVTGAKIDDLVAAIETAQTS